MPETFLYRKLSVLLFLKIVIRITPYRFLTTEFSLDWNKPFSQAVFSPNRSCLTSSLLYPPPARALSSCNAVVFQVESGAEDLAAYVPSDLSSPSSRWGAAVHALWVQEYENIWLAGGQLAAKALTSHHPRPSQPLSKRTPSIYGSPFMDLLVSTLYMRFSCHSIIHRYTHYHSSSALSRLWDPIWQVDGDKLQVNQYNLNFNQFSQVARHFCAFRSSSFSPIFSTFCPFQLEF